MTPIEEAILALAPGLAKLIASVLGDEYDQQKELDAIVQMQRAAADLRARKAIESRRAPGG